MGVVKRNWCCNYDEGATTIVFPARHYTTSSSTGDFFRPLESLGRTCQVLPSVVPMPSVVKHFVVAAHLAQCGDVESNPGPKREPKPDKAKIMADKVGVFDNLYHFVSIF